MIFILIIFIWAMLGIIGVIKCKCPLTNWYMIAFMGFVPFIPLVAKICGII